ncbi:MAG: glycosyltransferase family 2 protein [Treponema phagedenis]|uniref:glycosyltransferase family 2 protein n=1 Tax=Treponema phagedenis TaxID=162 RepID=UPI003133D23A
MKFSIIIPVYNRESYIDETLSSILQQTYTDWEVICIDDCSTDASLEKLYAYANNDKRIKVIAHHNNLGPHCARKTGVVQASGDYMLFLDCDDMLAVSACQTLYDELSKNRCDIVEFAYESNTVGTICYPVQFITIDNLFDSLVYFKNPRAGTVWNKVYKKELLQYAFLQMKDFYSIMGEDLYESIVIAYYAESYRFIQTPLLFYNDETGISNKRSNAAAVGRSLDSIKNNLDAFDIFFTTIAVDKPDAVIYIEQQYLKYVFYYLILGNTDKKEQRAALNLLPDYFTAEALLPYQKKLKQTTIGLQCVYIKYRFMCAVKSWTPVSIKQLIKRML